MSNPQHAPTTQQRRQAEVMAGYGMPQTTLRAHRYRPENTAQALPGRAGRWAHEGPRKVAANSVQTPPGRAKRTACIFWLKVAPAGRNTQRHGGREERTARVRALEPTWTANSAG